MDSKKTQLAGRPASDRHADHRRSPLRPQRHINVLAWSAEGAMGIVINKLVGHMNFSDLLEQLEIQTPVSPSRNSRFHFGGPVDMGRGFVLHTSDYDASDQTVRVTSSIPPDRDGRHIRKPWLPAKRARRALLALGYAGWAAGQLEHEIQANAWLHCNAEERIVF